MESGKGGAQQLQVCSKMQIELFRFGIPDQHKRQVILKLFNLKSSTCHFDYEAIKNSVSEEFKEYTAQVKLASEELHYDFLSEYGKKELDFILMYLH